MSKPHDIEVVKTDLQIEEELDAHRKGWTAQKVGLALLYALILAAAAGLFGDGIASNKKQSADQVTVESQRFYRFQAPMELKITAGNTSGDDVTVSFPNEYLKHFEVKGIVPEPGENRFADNRVEYTFDATGDADITFFLIPQSRGNISGSMDVNDQQFQLDHFIFP